MIDKTLIIVVGPTAIGKTKLAIELAQNYQTEIISADSRQFFKEMHIGTAVPSSEELAMVQHHFIQHKSIFEPYSVGDFERGCLKKLEELFKTHSNLILVGGSGLYVDAVVRGLDEFPLVKDDIRKQLIDHQKDKGLIFLQEKLKVLDPVYYEKVDLENAHRVIRALEICISTGQAYSSFLSRPKKKRFFKTVYIGISAERALIYDRINQRVDIMMDSGLLKEAKQLLPYKDLNALQTVGYKELFQYIEGKSSLPDAIEEIKKNTRRFAKRQLTWYRKNEAINWVAHDEPLEKIIANIEPKPL